MAPRQIIRLARSIRSGLDAERKSAERRRDGVAREERAGKEHRRVPSRVDLPELRQKRIGQDDRAVILKHEVVREPVRVEVGDPGEGFEPPSHQPTDLAEEGGWGLYLVDRLADRWGVSKDRGTMVWLEMDLAPVAQSA